MPVTGNRRYKRLGELKEEYVDDTTIEKYEVEG